MITMLLVSNAVLWVVVMVLAVLLVAAVRQLGVLHERISPVGALLLKQGLKVGIAAPVLTVHDMNGAEVRVGGHSASNRSMLIAFVSPSCPVCKAILPVLKASRLSERDWLDIVLASDGAEEEHRRFVAAQGLREFPYVLSAQLGMSFQVGRLPFAAIIDEHGVLRARGLVNSREHLESLFEAKRRGVASLQEYLEESQADGKRSGSQAA